MTGLTVRRATPDDAAELVRLRVLLYAGEEGAGGDGLPDWAAACEATVRRRLADEPDRFVAVVGDDPERPGRLVACGIGWVATHLPNPTSVTGERGHISTMVTEEHARRRGWGAAVFAGLLAFYNQHGIARVELNASPDGEALYRRYGFTDPADPALVWRAPPG